MSGNAVITRRAIAIVNMPKRVSEVVAYARQIATAMTGNLSFPAPTISLQTFEADVDALETAEQAVLTRAKGAAATRNVKLATVRSDLDHLKAYVQQVADQNASTSESVIHSAGFSVKKVAARNKADLAASLGVVSGSVHLVAKAVGKRVAYEWQYSLDQKTWTMAPSTLQSKTTLTGLTPSSTYYFRFRVLDKTGEGGWSQVIALLVA